MTVLCWECRKDPHSMGCGSKSRVDGLRWLLDSLHNVPSDVLTEVAFRVNVELLERELGFLEDEDENKSN